MGVYQTFFGSADFCHGDSANNSYYQCSIILAMYDMLLVCLVYSGPSAFRIAITVISLHSTGPLQPRLNCFLFELTLLEVQQAVWIAGFPSEVGPAHIVQSVDGEAPCLHAAAKPDE
jgi:hypothetical protein